eukprot:7376089-Prymnesium_polylepis.1
MEGGRGRCDLRRVHASERKGVRARTKPGYVFRARTKTDGVLWRALGAPAQGPSSPRPSPSARCAAARAPTAVSGWVVKRWDKLHSWKY